MAEKQTNKQRLKEITDSIEAGIQELFQSEKYRNYLRTMSRFHRYSFNNTMLIHMQKPDATLVTGYSKWEQKFNRHVKRGEKGIKIIAPTPFKKKIEQEKLDPDTKLPMRDKDGNIIIEEKEVQIPMFKPVVVFDVSQTEGDPLPTLVADLKGDVRNYEIFMEALRRSSPVPVEFERMAADMDGYFSVDNQQIAIREGMSEVQTVSAAVHEITHAKLHNIKGAPALDDKELYQEIELFEKPALFSNGRVDREKLPEGLFCYDLRGSDDDPGAPVTVEDRAVVVNHAGTVILSEPLEFEKDGYLVLGEEMNFVRGEVTLKHFYEQMHPDKVVKSRSTEEVEAESVSFAVCSYYGIETGENSFGYIATWSEGKELKELRASLELINKTADGLISDIDRNFAEICKERGIERESTEYEMVLIPPSYEQAYNFATEYVNCLMDSDPHFVSGTEKTIAEAAAHQIVNSDTAEIRAKLNDLAYQDDDSIYAPAAHLLRQLDRLYTKEYRAKEIEQETTERLYTVDDNKYLHVQRCDGGVDYTLYDMATKRELDGGQLDMSEVRLSAAALEICKLHNIGADAPIRLTNIEILEELQEAQFEKPAAPNPHYEKLVEHLAREDEKLWDTTLDEYPMPDASCVSLDVEAYGISDHNLLPISKEMAAEMIDRDLTVYAVTGEGAVMAFDRDEVEAHQDGTLFAMLREEWEQTAEFQNAVADRMNHQQEREAAFLNHAGDSFAIYQLKLQDEGMVRDLRYMSMDYLQKQGLQPDKANYELAYTAPLPEGGNLDTLWQQFNVGHPADYLRPSMSVSDIVAIRQDGVVSCHYVDSAGFQELPNFLQPDNYLKSAEMQMEDDYGMIDGIINNGPKEEPSVAELEAQVKAGQTISLMDLARATQQEKEEKRQKPAPEKRASVLEKMRRPLPTREEAKKAPERDTERGDTR